MMDVRGRNIADSPFAAAVIKSRIYSDVQKERQREVAGRMADTLGDP